MPIKIAALATTALMFVPFAAQAALTISDKPTKSVTCSDGTCSATAKHANMNAADLANMLSASDVTLSGFSGQDIVVAKVFQWASTHHFAMTSSKQVQVNAPIVVAGTSGLAITTGGNKLSFGTKGNIEFWDTASSLTIDGAAFTLAADFPTLSAAIAKDPGGNFAWAKGYDAKPDGVYTQNPVTSILAGRFEGLGNTIKNLTIVNSDRGVHVGMFYLVSGVTHLHLVNAHVRAKGTNATLGILAGACTSVNDVSVTGTISGAPASYIGGMCGVLSGNMSDVHSTAVVTGNNSTQKALGALGGLVGFLDGGVISNSYATGKITGGKGWVAGGLVGYTQVSTYTITGCYATGVVIVGDKGVSGGLVGSNAGGGAVDNSYATGFVGGGVGSTVGGLIGINNGPVSDSYSSGPVTSGSGNAVGGLIGNDWEADDLTDTYWDTTTSGQSHGVGNDTAYPGVTGLTTEEFQAGLPVGFDAAVWAEDPNINGGLPYLLALPPR
jgi:hypothetical protein